MADASTVTDSNRVNQHLQQVDRQYQEGEIVGDQRNNTRYPALLYKDNRELDTKVAIAKQLKDANWGDAVITDRLVDYFYDKEQEQEFVKREKWIADNFDLTNPVVKQWIDKILPSFTERREAFALKKLDEQKRLVKLAFHGPQDEEDLDFIYAIATGRINLANLATQPWVQDNQADDQSLYTRGLFNPRKWTGDTAIPLAESGKGWAGASMHWGIGNKNDNNAASADAKSLPFDRSRLGNHANGTPITNTMATGGIGGRFAGYLAAPAPGGAVNLRQATALTAGHATNF